MPSRRSLLLFAVLCVCVLAQGLASEIEKNVHRSRSVTKKSSSVVKKSSLLKRVKNSKKKVVRSGSSGHRFAQVQQDGVNNNLNPADMAAAGRGLMPAGGAVPAALDMHNIIGDPMGGAPSDGAPQYPYSGLPNTADGLNAQRIHRDNVDTQGTAQPTGNMKGPAVVSLRSPPLVWKSWERTTENGFVWKALNYNLYDLNDEPQCNKVDQNLLDKCDQKWIDEGPSKFNGPLKMGSYGVYTPICQIVVTTNMDCKAAPFKLWPECIHACQYMHTEFQKEECDEIFYLAREPCSCELKEQEIEYLDDSQSVVKTVSKVYVSTVTGKRCSLQEISQSMLECCRDQTHNCCWPV
eukprot:GILI01005490.1.p1 GENE.GILI01005490.1~~GILI01005490.1.p1  ORF type:complete len:351 (-),score=92.00 GILI01005490.1:47-1099(-)